MKSRIATLTSVLVLGVGTSGAIALAGHTSSHGPTGGAAEGQYWPGKDCGNQNHPRFTPDKPCPQPNGGSTGSNHGQSRGDTGHGQPEPSGGNRH